MKSRSSCRANNSELQTVLTATEVAQYLKVKEGTLRNWVYKSQIPHIKVNGALRFRIQDIDKWMDKSTIEAESY